MALISQLVDHKSLAVLLEGEAEIILEEVVTILGNEVGSMGIYFLVRKESKEAKQCPLNRCPPLKEMP